MLTRWKKDRLPRTAEAVVAGKREHTARQAYCRTCAVQPSEMVKTFYVTFRFEGEELELVVPGQEYEALAQGDKGLLTYQGTRYLNFERR